MVFMAEANTPRDACLRCGALCGPLRQHGLGQLLDTGPPPMSHCMGKPPTISYCDVL